jgi:hypothetical protein
MTGSLGGTTQAQVVQVEDLLRSFNITHANDNVAPMRSRRFDGRPVLAACLAFFVFAPGCAAAAVFLLRNDGAVPPLVAPESNPPQIAKSDRLPLVPQDTAAAEDQDSQRNSARVTVAMVTQDRKFLEPMLIRGSLDEGTITSFANDSVSEAVTTEPAELEQPAAPPKPRVKRHARRTPPVQVAEAAAPPAPEPPEPTFFEKLFGARFH